MKQLQSSRRPLQQKVSSNAVVPSNLVGVSSFLDRLLRMLSRQEFGAEESNDILAAVEHILRLTVNQFDASDDRFESHVFFALGPSEFSIRIENQRPQFSSAISSLSDDSGSPTIPAAKLFMDEVRCHAKGHAITLVRRRDQNQTELERGAITVAHPQTKS